jgi:monofunctional biosynthetic peptidoglycan transglycosylase
LKTADKKENSFSHDWESIENISVLQKAVIASEDGSFPFTTDLILRRCKKAYKRNERGRKIKGGTISNKQLKTYFYGRGVVTLGKD